MSLLCQFLFFLLKIIEEPTNKNYFFLINNKSKKLLETVKSRTLEIKIILNEDQRLKIIDNLIKVFKLDLVLDPQSSQLTPGNFVKFNYISKEFNISPLDDFMENLSLLLNLYKKNKDIIFINIAYFKPYKKNLWNFSKPNSYYKIFFKRIFFLKI